MSTTTTWPGGAVDATPTAYAVPASGELNWSSLSAFLNVLATSAQSTTAQKWGLRKATATPVTVSATADCVVVCQLSVAGAVAVNLPAGATKQVFVVVDGTGDAATNNITINRNGADTIAGATSLVLSVDRETVVLVYNASDTDWKIAARSRTVTPLASGVSGVLPIANGGTAKALTPAAGGLVWTDADSLEVGAAGTASMWALSGGTGAPTFSDTTTRPKTFSDTTDVTTLGTGAIITAGGLSVAKKIMTGTGVHLDDDTAAGGATALNYYREADHATTFIWNGTGSPVASASSTLKITRVGRTVTVLIPTTTATTVTSSTAFDSVIDLPAWACPAGTSYFIVHLRDAGSTQLVGYIEVNASGNISAGKVDSGVFTNASVAGIEGVVYLAYSV